MLSQTEMTRVRQIMQTPCKQGLVLHEEGVLLDCPNVFYDPAAGAWCMLFVRFDPADEAGSGYETWLAHSQDLLDWQVKGKVLAQGSGGWDDRQVSGGLALANTSWGGDHIPQKQAGFYWLSYLGGSRPGYETDPLSISLARTRSLSQLPWQRPLPGPVLASSDQDARDFEKATLYKSCIIRDEKELLGAPFVMFYNAKQPRHRIESIGLAVSDNLLDWKRFGDGPCLGRPELDHWHISGDPQLVRLDDLWVMHYFVAHGKSAYDTFACSRDLLHWTLWEGEPLVQPSAAYDEKYAHKPYVLKHQDIVYHFYCAVGQQGRGIALATSRPL